MCISEKKKKIRYVRDKQDKELQLPFFNSVTETKKQNWEKKVKIVNCKQNSEEKSIFYEM